MSNVAVPTPRPARGARATTGSVLWFALMVGLWTAFVVLAAASAGTLSDLWNWIRGLPLALELLAWLLAFPWVLALAVWESSWADWLRVTLVACFAAGWTLASIPRAARPSQG